MKIITSNNFVPPEAIGIVYSKDLRNLVKAMIKDYKSLITIYRDKKDQIAIDADEKKPNVTYGQVWLTTEIQERLHKLGKKWEEKFAVWAESQSPKVIKKVLKASDTQIKRALIHFYSAERLELIGQVIPNPLKQSMKMHIVENVSLIKSIQSQYHERVIGAVSRSITGAGSIKSLTQEINKYGQMGERRANLIALDQTRKMYSNLTVRRFEQVGITKVQWLHTHHKETSRPYHIRKWDGDYSNYPNVNGLNGLIFDISNPPVIQQATKTQPEIRGWPSQLPFCYHKDTEVYTERGFVPIKDVIIGEKVLTLDPYTKQPEWSECVGTTSKYVEKIVNLKSNTFNIKTDINHRFFAYRAYYGNSKKPQGMKPDFIDGVYNIPKKHTYFYGSSEWVGKNINFVKVGEQEIPIDDYLLFMAYYLSEGSIDNRDKTTRISISQQKYKEKMFEDLAWFNPHKVKAGINIYNKELREYCKQFGNAKDKFVPDIIKELPKEKIRLFLDAFALGDGSPKKVRQTNMFVGNRYACYYTSSKRMADDFVELIIKSGMGVAIRKNATKGKFVAFENGMYQIKTDVYCVQEKKTTKYNMRSIKIKEEPYNDIVYDIEVKDNHTLLIKYGSSVSWNSNCRCIMRAVIEE